MSKYISLLILLVMTAGAFNVHAQNNSVKGDNYWIVSLDQLTFGEDATFPGEDDHEQTSVNFAFGYRINNYLSAEANMSWWQVNKFFYEELSTGVELAMVSAQGISLRLDVPLVSRLSAYGQASYNLVRIDIRGPGTIHDKGFGYSGGLQYKVKNGAVFVRYAMILDNENDPADTDRTIEDLTAMGIGYKMDLPF